MGPYLKTADCRYSHTAAFWVPRNRITEWRQDMQIENFQTISKMAKGCLVRSVVVNSLIYLDAKWDGMVIIPVHLLEEIQPLSCKCQWLTASIRDSHRIPALRLHAPVTSGQTHCLVPPRQGMDDPTDNPAHHIHHAHPAHPRRGHN